MRELTLRELNRATLARQLLLERRTARRARRRSSGSARCRRRSRPPRTSALWSRVAGFDRDALTRAYEQRRIVRATLMRITIHMLSARDFLALAPVWRARRLEQPGADERAVRTALAADALTHAELRRAVGEEVYNGRYGSPLPIVHLPPAGTWRNYSRVRLADAEAWLGRSVGDPATGAKLLVRRYLARVRARLAGRPAPLLGPAASRTSRPGSTGCGGSSATTAASSSTCRARRLPAADTPAPVRFLGRWDNAHLGYDRRARILPDEFAELQIGHDGNQTFLVDGFVAGGWEVERARTTATLALSAFAPLPRPSRREVEDEAAALARWHQPDADVHKVRWS